MKFEELEAWQAARKLTKQIYGLTQTPELARDFGLTGQSNGHLSLSCPTLRRGSNGRTSRKSLYLLTLISHLRCYLLTSIFDLVSANSYLLTVVLQRESAIPPNAPAPAARAASVSLDATDRIDANTVGGLSPENGFPGRFQVHRLGPDRVQVLRSNQ